MPDIETIKHVQEAADALPLQIGGTDRWDDGAQGVHGLVGYGQYRQDQFVTQYPTPIPFLQRKGT